MGDSSDQELCYSLRWARGRVGEGHCSGSLFPLRQKTSMLGVYQNLYGWFIAVLIIIAKT